MAFGTSSQNPHETPLIPKATNTTLRHRDKVVEGIHAVSVRAKGISYGSSRSPKDTASPSADTRLNGPAEVAVDPR